MTVDPRIDDFIRQHRTRLTREAITGQLVAEGISKSDVDAAWERLARDEPMAGPQTRTLSGYVWIMYWLGAALIGAWAVFGGLASAGGIGLLGIGWLAMYLAIAYYPARALAQAETNSAMATLAVIVAAPFVVLLIGGGICAATIALVAGMIS
jgi:hypothetical protein